MDIALDFKDEITPALKALKWEAPGILDAGLSASARGYRAHALKYLKSMLHKRTGETQKQLRFLKPKGTSHVYKVLAPMLANIYEANRGATIVPKRGRGKKARLRFVVGGKTVFAKRVHLARRPFMSASYLTFDFQGRFDTAAIAAIDRTRVKLGLS